MNAGKSYEKAREHAQRNADRDGRPRYLHGWAGAWWIDREPCDGAEEIKPARRRQSRA